MTIITITSF